MESKLNYPAKCPNPYLEAMLREQGALGYVAVRRGWIRVGLDCCGQARDRLEPEGSVNQRRLQNPSPERACARSWLCKINLTSRSSGCCCAGSGPLRERRITMVCCAGGGAPGGMTHPSSGWCCAGSGPLRERRLTTVCCAEGGAPGGITYSRCGVVLRRFRPPTGEENHDGMLR